MCPVVDATHTNATTLAIAPTRLLAETIEESYRMIDLRLLVPRCGRRRRRTTITAETAEFAETFACDGGRRSRPRDEPNTNRENEKPGWSLRFSFSRFVFSSRPAARAGRTRMFLQRRIARHHQLARSAVSACSALRVVTCSYLCALWLLYVDAIAA